MAGSIPDVGHIIAVGAGKGGVGKSTISVALALALARRGEAVGLLDGDIYGPSIPTMLGLDRLGIGLDGQTMIPIEVHGIRTTSIGKLVEPDKPLMWRGPMAHAAFRQLLSQTRWGRLDWLVVDLPPGTGDVPLTLAQLVGLNGAVIVCTPQRVAQDDARRAVAMFRQLSVPVLGVVENMSSFIGDDGREYDLFGKGGGHRLAEEVGVPFLGEIPITPSLRRNCDEGTPLRLWEDQRLGAAVDAVAEAVRSEASRAGQAQARPTIDAG